MPAFYSRESGVQLDHQVDNPKEIAAMYHARGLARHRGILILNPIPNIDEIPRD